MSLKLLLSSHDELWYAPASINIVMLNLDASQNPKSSQDLSFKPPSLDSLTNNNLVSHLLILEYLSSCKTSASGSNKEEGKLQKNMTLKPLYHLHDIIINLFITYLIICAAAANLELDTNSTQSQALVTKKKELDKHIYCHNYTPFWLYLVAGVCGLMLASTNRRFASGATALGFLTAVEHIFKKNLAQCEVLETIWKKLGAYIDNLFIQPFFTPNCLFNFCALQIIQLITYDFLACHEIQLPEK
ncbi:hypothetical protein VP01_952g8 [Puccinia sorghi]|uniref:Uncharacterized protein n=1 Tax=Puccinia sorghi TaxID=27349 RepID=A0A0L6U6C8_9BASI|nr:hypothetical protein VP01_952g8 [Puccinia sorghi]